LFSSSDSESSITSRSAFYFFLLDIISPTYIVLNFFKVFCLIGDEELGEDVDTTMLFDERNCLNFIGGLEYSPTFSGISLFKNA